MASHQFRPQDPPPLGYGAQPPLQFVASSFSAQEQGVSQPLGGGYGGPMGASTSSYPHAHAAYGGPSFDGPSGTMGRQMVGTMFAASASFDDEPPLLEGERTPCEHASV